MLKVNFCVVIALTLAPTIVLSVVLRGSYNQVLDNKRRIATPSQHESFFLSGLYNRKGKAHDLGADWGLTSDVYTKINPYYLQYITPKPEPEPVEKKLEPVYYPVYNHSVTQDGASASSDEAYETIPSSYDTKTKTYVSSSYGAPSHSYGAPSYSVQSVQSSSYVPSSSYGSPGISSYYPHPSYGPPPSSYYPPTSMMPHPMPEAAQKSNSEWLIAKIMKKFDLILVSKILLKLIIFKKIVKFIGLICLLMFIPVLKKKFEEHTSDGDGDEDEERRIKELDAYANVDFRLKEIVNFALTSIENFSADNIPWCVGESVFYCRVQYMLDGIDLRYPGSRIMGLWFPELETTTATPTTTTESSTDSLMSVDEGDVDFNDFISESPELVSAEDEDSTDRLKKFQKMFKRP